MKNQLIIHISRRHLAETRILRSFCLIFAVFALLIAYNIHLSNAWLNGGFLWFTNGIFVIAVYSFAQAIFALPFAHLLVNTDTVTINTLKFGIPKTKTISLDKITNIKRNLGVITFLDQNNKIINFIPGFYWEDNDLQLMASCLATEEIKNQGFFTK